VVVQIITSIFDTSFDHLGQMGGTAIPNHLEQTGDQANLQGCWMEEAYPRAIHSSHWLHLRFLLASYIGQKSSRIEEYFTNIFSENGLKSQLH
jgi:hypothetical protein